MSSWFKQVNVQRMFTAHDTRLKRLEAKLRVSQDQDEAHVPPGGFGFTLFVAASNALRSSTERADYRCDGTNDHVEINAALDACHDLWVANGAGGRVVLSEGIFNVRSPGVFQGFGRPGGTTLQGQGMGATVLRMITDNDNCITFNGPNTYLADLGVDGSAGLSGAVVISGDDCHVERVRFYDVGGGTANLYMDGQRARVNACRVVLPKASKVGIAMLSTAEDAIIINNHVADTGFEGIIGNKKSIVIGNLIRNSQKAAPFPAGPFNAITVGIDSVVLGNVCLDWNGAPATIASGAGSQVANNVLR